MRVDKTIYLDYQASTPIDSRVLKVMHNASTSLFANPHAADHVLGWRAAAAIELASAQVGQLFGLQSEDIVFTSGASEANAMAIRTAVSFASQSGRGTIMVGAGDHGSIQNEAIQSGLNVKSIALDMRGAPDPASLESVISGDAVLVSVVGVNNENGAIADLHALAKVCELHGALLHVDLSQSPLAIDVDLLDLNIAFATVSAHKIYGPKGIGAMLIGPGYSDLIKPVIVGAGQQGGRRGGTLPTELIAGFGEACRIASEEGQEERERVAEIRDEFVRLLEKKQVASLIGDKDNRHPGNALMRFPNHDASDLLSQLQPFIAASTQSACSSGKVEPSHVLQAMGLDRTAATECIRFSFGRFSDKQQVHDAVSHFLDLFMREM